jgi:replicative DNA helicase
MSRQPEKRQRLEPSIVAGRVPPHDLDAEAAVLSAILLERDALDRVLEMLHPEHFYSDSNGRIFEACRALALEGQPVDITTAAGWLRDRGRLSQVGGPSYLAQLADATPAVAHVAAHAQAVYEKWRVRALIATCQRIAAEGYGDYGPPQGFIDGAEQAIYELARTASRSTVRPIREGLAAYFKALEDAAARGDRITGISTGFDKLDAKTAGLHAGDLVIVAARPGMGKTSFVLNLAVNVATPREITLQRDGQTLEHQVDGFGVAFFSMEMPNAQISGRAACSEARVDVGLARQGYLQPDHWRRLTEASAFLAALPLWIDDTPALGLLALRAKVRRIQAEYNRAPEGDDPGRRLGVVVIDYLQLMKGPETAQNREQEISAISRGLKALAKELDVCVVALSQLNRSVENRADRRPELSDLRESGAIEQDADTIIFIYREDYYNPGSDLCGLAELLVKKQRNGPTGKVWLKFFESCTRFDNLAAGDYPTDAEA